MKQRIEKSKEEIINVRRIKDSPGKYIYKTNVDLKNKDIELVKQEMLIYLLIYIESFNGRFRCQG